ncbi:glycoside hydrolase family 88 protein [Echinicola sediminis]
MLLNHFKRLGVGGLWVLLLYLIFPFQVRAQAASEDFYHQELDKIVLEVKEKLVCLEVDSTRIPRALSSQGELVGVSSRDWTSGFFPGLLWYLYEHSQDKGLRFAAKEWTGFIEKEKYDGHTHDTGFKVYCSFGNGYRLLKNTVYKNVIIETANTLMTRYDPVIGCIRSWDFNREKWKFPVIIDNMMNLEMLFAATRLTGDSSYYQAAKQHAMTTKKHHFRPDFSSYHVVDYDTVSGMSRLKTTHQGYSPESSWARGQAWALYGYTMCYRETGEKEFLVQAENIADFILSHPRLPEDQIPFWDFDDPAIPNAERDASAASVIASALLELSHYTNLERGKDYWKVATKILKHLSSPEYRLDSKEIPFLLNHSVGSLPHESEVDVPLVYADYYYVEALTRAKNFSQFYRKE